MKVSSSESSKHRAVITLLVVAVFGLGLAAGAYYYGHVRREAQLATGAPPGVILSDATQSILQRLDSPVDITFYSPSDPVTLPPALRDFSARTQQLLTEYEQAGQGKIRLNHSDPTGSAASKTAAGAAGVLPFAGNDGTVCYLGVTVGCGNQKETIPLLSPDWEVALESDLSRAIARVSASVVTPALPVAQASSGPAPIDPVLSEELVRTIPDLDSRSYDDAAKVLREASMAEFTAAVRKMQATVQETQKELATQGSKSEVDQQAASKQLQQVQAEQSQKLSEITARLQARLQVLERLKGVNRSASK